MDTSTAQHGEDLAILKRFERKRNGFFVEIGALDGVRFSNTYLLESQYEWQGILIEANPAQAELCKVNRPNSKVAGVAVTSPALAGKELSLTVVDGFEALSTFDLVQSSHETIERHRAAGEKLDVFEVKVPARTIDDVLIELGCPSSFDVLSIDIEGHEVEALAGADLGSKWKPAVVIVENGRPFPDFAIGRLLHDYGYTYRRSLGVNDWYEPRTSRPLWMMFVNEFWHYRRLSSRAAVKWVLAKLRLMALAQRLRS